MKAANVLATLSEEGRSRSLRHPAFTESRVDSYERLEWLGDAIIGAGVAALLYEAMPDSSEGDLAELRAAVVSRRVCARIALEVGLVDAFVEDATAVARAPERQVADLASRESVHAALVEAVVGQVFREQGWDAAARLVEAWFGPHVEHEDTHHIDFKSALQTWAQERSMSVAYDEVSSSGPDHDRWFVMRARIEGGDESAEGEGRSKKAAEQQAARTLLKAVNPDEALPDGPGH